MSEEIAQRTNEFKRTGNFSILVELDKLPLAKFNDPQIRQQSYMWCQSSHSLNFTCYQHALAFVIDHFHPGIATYISSEFPEITSGASDYFVNILNKMLGQVARRRKSYSNLVKSRKADFFDKIEALEQKIESEGYVIALGGFHGEVYVFERDQTLTAVIQSESLPVKLWVRGNAKEWYDQNKDGYSIISNEHILEFDLLFHDSGINFGTRFFGRSELETAFTQYDLRKIIRNCN
ncbi:MAG: hypothetical protein AABY26_04560 [Nanoarchaeota archaeon]